MYKGYNLIFIDSQLANEKEKKKSFPNQVFYIYLENLLSVDWQISMAYFLVWKHHISGIWEELGGVI